MPHFHEENAYEAPPQTTPQTVSTDRRPPQLNQTICGCRCGCGCNNDLGGEGNSEDRESVQTVETLVAMSDDGEGLPSSSDGPGGHAPEDFSVQHTQSWRQASFGEIRNRFGGYIHDAQGLQLNGSMNDWASFRTRDRFPHSPDDMARSMKNNPDSDERSAISSDARSVRCISPGPGLGSWIEQAWEDEAGLMESPNHFSSRPLRLTPQRQFCRGLVASHLVLIDDGMHSYER
jgi:hypothetical protein